MKKSVKINVNRLSLYLLSPVLRFSAYRCVEMNTKRGAIRLTRPPDSKLSGEPIHIFTFDHIYDSGFVFLLVTLNFFLPLVHYKKLFIQRHVNELLIV